MRKSSIWLRFVCFLGFTLLLFAGTWFAQHSETPPWRSENSKDAKPASLVPSIKSSPKTIHSASFRFVSYNLKNWLTSTQTPEKSPESKQAIIEILTSSQADVIGLSEIGSEEDIIEIQQRLKQAGHDLPYFHHTGGIDPIRHLGILSKFPITSKHQPDIALGKSGDFMQRGMLDVELDINHEPIRFIGIHLKSKRTVQNYDQADLRVREAEHVRNYVDGILSKEPNTRLILYGDFNDHVQSLSTKTILGKHGDPNYLTPIDTADQDREKWTHYFEAQDSYSRIDFVAVSKSLKSQVDHKASRIMESPKWNIASDHRAILVSFR